MIKYDFDLFGGKFLRGNNNNARIRINGGRAEVLVEAVVFTKVLLDSIKQAELDEKSFKEFKKLYLEGVKGLLEDDSFDINEFTIYALEMFKIIDDKGEL